jgi:hypothetical protein
MKLTRTNRMPEPRLRGTRRRGFTTPAVAIALLVVMCGLALILDRLWLDSADLELTTAAEAAALVAAGELANDDLLKQNADPETRFELARVSAGWIASQNLVAGSPVVLDTTSQGDIRLGRLVLDDQSGKVRFEETTNQPTTAVVTAMRTRRTNNPVGLFVAGATGKPFGDVVSRVEATVDNRVCGVRPQNGTPVPAYPLAIWRSDPSGLRADTWECQIEARRGADQFGYDPIGHRVYSGSDGIPEIVLRSGGSGTSSTNSNVLVIDVGSGLKDDSLARQFASGWSADDMAATGGEMRLALGTPVLMNASNELRHADREALESLLGEPRICLLYSSAIPSGSGQLLQAACERMVAIRILAVRDQSDGTCEVVAQPCVLKTKTAILDAGLPYSTDSVVQTNPVSTAATTAATAPATTAGTVPTTTAGTAPTTTAGTAATNPGNPYIYKLHLTH